MEGHWWKVIGENKALYQSGRSKRLEMDGPWNQMIQDPTHVNLTILTSEPSVKSERSFDIKVEGPKTRDGQKWGKKIHFSLYENLN